LLSLLLVDGLELLQVQVHVSVNFEPLLKLSVLLPQAPLLSLPLFLLLVMLLLHLAHFNSGISHELDCLLSRGQLCLELRVLGLKLREMRKVLLQGAFENYRESLSYH
jgi:hypothetical protein